MGDGDSQEEETSKVLREIQGHTAGGVAEEERSQGTVGATRWSRHGKEREEEVIRMWEEKKNIALAAELNNKGGRSGFGFTRVFRSLRG